METQNTAVATVNDEMKVTEKLLLDYLTTLTERLTDAQRTQFLAVAQAFNLNPFKREIYAIKYGNNFNIIVGYEVYLKRAIANPRYDGYECTFGQADGDTFCKCSVFIKGFSHPVTSCVWKKEYDSGKSLWASKPKCMLEKVAICTAFRRAFPEDYAGIPYTADELGGAETLNAQGLTEVVIDNKPVSTPAKKSAPVSETPVQKPVNPVAAFSLTLKGYAACNPEAFDLLKSWMKGKGWERPSAVGVNDYQEVYDKWAELCNNDNQEEA